MEFIKVEQLKEQPIEVQKVFLDWWECKPFDIYAWTYNLKDNKWTIESCSNQVQADSINKCKDITIPLFTEGQLRKFIEDKINRKVQSMINIFSGEYAILIGKKENMLAYTGTDDLFQAYWKVACMIAKEEVDE